MAYFGWSAGDLVLVIRTVVTVIDALDKADGASAHYQSTSLFFKALRDTLHYLRSATAFGLDPNYTAAVHAQVDLIKTPLVDFINEISKYEKSLGASSARGPLRVLPRKLKWTFEMEEKASKLERKVAGPLACISILLTQQNLVAVSSLERHLPTKICSAIADKFDENLIELIKAELRPLVQPVAERTSLEARTAAIQLGHTDPHYQLAKQLEEQGVTLQDIQASLRRLDIRESSEQSPLTLGRPTQRDPGLTTFLCAIAASLATLWQGLLAVSGPELLFLLHALSLSLEAIPVMSMGDSFTFVDVYGRRDRLPWIWFQSWNVFHEVSKAIQTESMGEEMAMMNVYGLTKRSQASGFMVRHELWSYIMRPRLELALGIIVVTISENEPDCPRCFALRIPDQKCSNCGLLFYRPFVSANPNPNVIVSEPYKVKASATPSADIAAWSNRGIGYWQPIANLHWLDNVKRVVSIYTRRPSTRLILFTFDCVLEQLWLTWSTNSKLQHILLENTQGQQTSSDDLISITSELSSFRSKYSPLATFYHRKASPLSPEQKATLQKNLLASTRSLKSLLRNLRSWLALSRISGNRLESAALPSLFSSLFHTRFSELIHTLHHVAQILDILATPNINLDTNQKPNISIEVVSGDNSPSLPLPASNTPQNQSGPSSSRSGYTQYPPVSPTALDRARLYREYLLLPSSASIPRFWWCGYACDACAFELTNDEGRWRCNRCNHGDYDLCAQCLIETGGCKGQKPGEEDWQKHVLEWVPHPFLERAWKKWEID